MKLLPHPDNLHLEAVQGWLMLGNPAAAGEELERLTARSRTEPDVLELEWAVHAAAPDWAKACAVAELLVETAPDRPFGWIHRAYALRRMPGGSIDQARDALRPAFERFPDQFLIPYNLACYAAQLGELDEAWTWLGNAMSAVGTLEGRTKIRDLALADRDLEALWPRLRGSELA